MSVFAAIVGALAALTVVEGFGVNLQIAWSAFFGIRAPADIPLGWEHVGFAVLPGATALFTWLAVRTVSLRQSSCWWLAGRRSERAGKALIVGVPTLVAGFISVAATISII